MFNYLIMHSPFIVQYIFSERVVLIVKKEWQEEANQILQSKEKGGVSTWRQNQPLRLVRTVRMGMLHLPRAYQSTIAYAKLYGGYCRTQITAGAWRHAHVG